MIIFKDKKSNDEMFSDAFTYKVVMDGIAYRVQGKFVTQSTDVGQVDIGGNASQEAPEEQADDVIKVSGVDVVLSCKLNETFFSDFNTYVKTYFKEFCKNQVEGLEDEKQEKFKEDMKTFAKFVKSNFSELQFFQGESYNDEGSLGYLIYEDEVPCLYFIKDTLIAEKF